MKNLNEQSFQNPYFSRKKGPEDKQLTFNNNSPIKAVLQRLDVQDILRETMPRSMVPIPTSETPIYFNEQSAEKSFHQREYETPGTNSVTSLRKQLDAREPPKYISKIRPQSGRTSSTKILRPSSVKKMTTARKQMKSPIGRRSPDPSKKSNLSTQKRTAFVQKSPSVPTVVQYPKYIDTSISDFKFIKVSARVRPMLQNEINSQKVLSVIRKNKANMLGQDVIALDTGAHYNNGRKFFEFNSIMDEKSTQDDVFEECDLPFMCESFLKKGQNCNIMVYGPTNSGKTFTMLGKHYQNQNENENEKNKTSPEKTFKRMQRPGSSFGLVKKIESEQSIKVFKRRPMSSQQENSPSSPILPQEDGIVPQSLREILDLYNNYENGFIRQNYELKLSFLEIYNDNIIDLLSNYNCSSTQNKSLLIKENNNQITVEGLSVHQFSEIKETDLILNHALYNRKVFETTKNTQSSRSHAILQIKLYSRQMEESDIDNLIVGSLYGQKNAMFQEIKQKQSRLISQFTFVDLAGSEKLEGEQDQQRISEAKFINKSLSALGGVIQAMVNKQNEGSKKLNGSSYSIDTRKSSASSFHVPYRDSKLTHILKSCFNNGNSMTHVIICLSPCQNSQQECISSMKFAQNAKTIQQCLKEQQTGRNFENMTAKEIQRIVKKQKQQMVIDPEKLLSMLQNNKPAASSDLGAEESDIDQIEELLLQAKTSQNLHQALLMSINQLKKFHANEIELTKKVQNLENIIKKQNAFTAIAGSTSKFGSEQNLIKKHPLDSDSYTYMECNSIGFSDEIAILSKMGLSSKETTKKKIDVEISDKSIDSNEELIVLDPTTVNALGIVSENVSIDHSPPLASNRKQIKFSKFIAPNNSLSDTKQFLDTSNSPSKLANSYYYTSSQQATQRSKRGLQSVTTKIQEQVNNGLTRSVFRKQSVQTRQHSTTNSMVKPPLANNNFLQQQVRQLDVYMQERK